MKPVAPGSFAWNICVNFVLPEVVKRMRNQSNSKSQNCKFFARMIAGQALQTFLLNSCPKYFRWGSRKKSARLVVKPYKGTRKNKSRKKYARNMQEFDDKVGRKVY
jgi:hypothetical protein